MTPKGEVFRIEQVSQLPVDVHYVIIEDQSVFIPEQESTLDSRLNVSSSTVKYVAYLYFEDKRDWESAILKRVQEGGEKNWKAMVVTPAKITTNISVELKQGT
jgi:hypothetical protein